MAKMILLTLIILRISSLYAQNIDIKVSTAKLSKDSTKVHLTIIGMDEQDTYMLIDEINSVFNRNGKYKGEYNIGFWNTINHSQAAPGYKLRLSKVSKGDTVKINRICRCNVNEIKTVFVDIELIYPLKLKNKKTQRMVMKGIKKGNPFIPLIYIAEEQRYYFWKRIELN